MTLDTGRDTFSHVVQIYTQKGFLVNFRGLAETRDCVYPLASVLFDRSIDGTDGMDFWWWKTIVVLCVSSLFFPRILARISINNVTVKALVDATIN